MTRETRIQASIPAFGGSIWATNVFLTVPGRLSLDECVDRLMTELLRGYREELAATGGKGLEVKVFYDERHDIGDAYDWQGLIAKRMEECK